MRRCVVLVCIIGIVHCMLSACSGPGLFGPRWVGEKEYDFWRDATLQLYGAGYDVGLGGHPFVSIEPGDDSMVLRLHEGGHYEPPVADAAGSETYFFVIPGEIEVGDVFHLRPEDGEFFYNMASAWMNYQMEPGRIQEIQVEILKHRPPYLKTRVIATLNVVDRGFRVSPPFPEECHRSIVELDQVATFRLNPEFDKVDFYVARIRHPLLFSYHPARWGE